MLKKVKSKKYQEKIQARAAYEAGRPTDPTYRTDATDEVFQNPADSETEDKAPVALKKKPKKKNKKRKMVPEVAA